MSKAVEDERNKLLQDEENELQEAIRQSELEFKYGLHLLVQTLVDVSQINGRRGAIGS